VLKTLVELVGQWPAKPLADKMAITGTAAKKIDQNFILLDAMVNPLSKNDERDTKQTQQEKILPGRPAICQIPGFFGTTPCLGGR
jgi:hypothetical protein